MSKNYDITVQVWKKVEVASSPVKKALTVERREVVRVRNFESAKEHSSSVASRLRKKYGKDADFLEIKQYIFEWRGEK